MDKDALTSSGSIWAKISRPAFEKNIDELAGFKKYVPGERDYTVDTKQGMGDGRILPFELERRLADDFAFISSCDFGVEYVTAATIEQSKDRQGLTLCLAANEGIRPEVSREVLKILGKLELCSTKCLERKACEQDIFDIIVNLNINKILGRLSSKHIELPGHIRRQKRELLSEELYRFVTKVSVIRGGNNSNPDFFYEHLSRFQCCCIKIERCQRENIFDEVKLAIKTAYQMNERYPSFYHHLKSLGLTASALDVSVVRKMDKLSNYWRISRDLALICTSKRRYRQCRPLFNHLSLYSVPHHDSISSANTHIGIPRFVHAEIQMMVHHETNGSPRRPRVIGSSKAACYLCDTFIKAHGMFQISKAHRQVYSKWTVPDALRLNKQALDRFRIALCRVNGEVRQELRLARGYHQGRSFPFQSSINLNNTVISTRSNSTVASLVQVEDNLRPGACRKSLSQLAIESEKPGSVSSLRLLSINDRDSEDCGNGGVLDCAKLESRSEPRPESSVLGNEPVVGVANMTSTALQSCNANASSLETARRSQCSPKKKDPSPTASISASTITNEIHSVTREAHAHLKSSKSNVTDLEYSISSAKPSIEDVATEKSVDDYSNHSTVTICAGSDKEGIWHKVRSNSPRELHIGAFHLHVYLEESSEGVYTHASIKTNHLPPESIDKSQAHKAITLALGEEKVVSCEDHAMGKAPRKITIGDDHGGAVDFFLHLA